MSTISINENGVWAGDGELNDGVIRNCPAVLGDDQDMADHAYAAIEDAIDAGQTKVTIADYTWTWQIEGDDLLTCPRCGESFVDEEGYVDGPREYHADCWMAMSDHEQAHAWAERAE